MVSNFSRFLRFLDVVTVGDAITVGDAVTVDDAVTVGDAVSHSDTWIAEQAPHRMNTSYEGIMSVADWDARLLPEGG